MAKHHRVTKNEQDEKRQRRAKRVAAELSNDQAGPASLAQLQQQVGNRAVQRLLAQRSEDGTLDNNEAVQVPRQRMDPSTIARDWRVRTGPGATEWPRYEELRNILEREVEPGIGGARWRFEVLEEDEIGPTRWRVTPPAREMEELGYSYSREVTRENILQQLEAWIAQERGAGYLPAEAGVRAPPQPPPWLVPEGRRFFQSAVRGVGIRYGEPDLRFFGPRIDIVRTYEAQVRISTPSQFVRVYRVRGGRTYIEALRFAPTDRNDPFYERRDYDGWQDWNYQIVRLVVEQGMSVQDAFATMHAIDIETIRQMLAYVAVSRV